MSITEMGGASGKPKPAGQEPERSPSEIATSAVRAVKAEAASFAATAQDKVSEKVSEKTQLATQTLGDFATAIRKAGDDLAQHDQSVAGKVVKQAADGLEAFSRSISDKRPEELLDAVRSFGRNNPAAFIAGSVLLGIAMARVAKSTEHRSDDTGYKTPTDYLRASDRPSSEASSYTDGYPTTPSVDRPYGVGA